jgi:hypothetical protein
MCEDQLAGIRRQLEAMDRARLICALTFTETFQYNRLAAKERRLLRRLAITFSHG